ncbi:MAG: hypothetical protein QOJ00_2766 [Actinomycetota bacterium]
MARVTDMSGRGALPDAYVTTRLALHAVAEHILGAASYAAIGRIGLRSNESGFATQQLLGRTFTVSGPFITDGERSLLLTGSTLRGVAEWAGITPGAPAAVYTPSTPLDLDTPLDIDADCAVMVGEWFAAMQPLLSALVEDVADASPLQLWPEHFDLATDFGDDARGRRANYGASPGDGARPEPYLYVGPWNVDAVRENAPMFFFTDAWGAAMPYAELVKAANPLAAADGFLRRAKRLLT